MKNEKYWEVLLSGWRAAGRTGLRIPFIIGSQHFLPDDHHRQSINELHSDTADSSTEIFLKYCFDLDDLIIETRAASNRNSAGFYPSYRGKPQDGLFVSSQSRSEGATMEEVIISMEER